MHLSPAYWWFRLRSAARWYLNASTRYDIHSPLLSDFIREVWRDDRWYAAFTTVRQLRAFWGGVRRGRVQLLSQGAPSKTTTAGSRSVSSLVRTNAISEREGQLLFRLALWLRAENLLEFGTNAGISTVYLHGANTAATLHTVEGNPEVAALARRTFELAGVGPGLRAHTGLFTDWLDAYLPGLPPQDLVFLDGDHRYAATLEYVRRLLPRLHEKSVLIVADIHWSEGMERAWAELRGLERVTASIDTYHFGLLFFRPELRGRHLGLVRTRWKPWRMGFF